MTWYGNLCPKLQNREIDDSCTNSFQRARHVSPDLVQRIGFEAELEGHTGCVNCLEWNEKGSLLASGSDDVHVIIWDPFSHKSLTTINTHHNGNIFSVKFLPHSNDGTIVTGAADCKIRVHDIQAQETTQLFSCHVGRVKRIATCPNVPFMFWSAAEDGTIMQFDLRTPETACSSNPQNVLINLNAHMENQAEAKCLAINPLRSELLAVGANDPYIRLYDRRMLSCKSVKFSSESRFPSEPRLSWERDSVSKMMTSAEEFSLPAKSAKYFIAGHLPQKRQDYTKRFRTLASTYLTFSPDGSELLVNLGGEQIYLFNVNQQRKPQKLFLPIYSGGAHSNGIVKESSNGHTNGFSIMSTNGVTNGVSKHLAAKDTDTKKRRPVRPLPLHVEAIKLKANAAFDKKSFNRAIFLYNQAISMVPDSPILFGNRAAAYMKRGWDGDTYAALRDCIQATRLDQDHLKAHFRLAHCLHELSWNKEAMDCLTYFKTKFPDSANSQACENLDRDIKAAIYSKTDTDKEPENQSDDKSPSRGGRLGKVSDQESQWRVDASDYELRFCGHCNTTTDIKEANFFGSNGQYIVAGSDDGSFFIWEKATTNIVRVLRGDESIVNCLQPHPTTCLLATSGIDNVVRLWSPRPQNGMKDEREVDNSDDAASANQKRMNADPLEVMLMNMGYRLPVEGEEEEERENRVQCAPS